MWGAKIDLQHAYFHLGLAKDLRPYMHFQVGTKRWQFQGACFGLNILPQLFMQMMKTFQRKWCQAGIMCYIYLDDILLLGTTKTQVEKDLIILLQDLQQSGMQVNQGKSLLQPTQLIPHLGFMLDLKKGSLIVPPQKLKSVRKELGKFLTKTPCPTEN